MTIRLDSLHRLLQEAVSSAEPELAPGAPAAADPLRWEVPKDPSLGDLSSPAAFKLASRKRQPPQQVAEALVRALQEAVARSPLQRDIDRLEAKAGFVNLRLSHRALADVVVQILRRTRRYGLGDLGRGRSVLVEFVSANPTGPLSVAHGRQAAVGDALSHVLRSQAYRVIREYYLNDEGHQIELLGRSLWLRCKEQLGQGEPFPEDGYHGAYVIELAQECAAREGAAVLKHPPEWFVETAMERQLAGIKGDLLRFGLRFDNWESQRDIRVSDRIDEALKELRRRGLLFEQDGATWFASRRFGDDKDRVVKKQTGELTYLAPDIAYHRLKYQRKYDVMVNLWGPDHHGYIARLKAAMTALGLPAERLTVRIVQLVTLSRHGKPVPMSKRQGEFVTFREVLDEVGVDATRFFYLMRTMDSHLDFDLDLAKSQSQDNPVYYVQYAHARICSIIARARAELPWYRRLGAPNLSALTAPEERVLMRQLFLFPIMLASCAAALEPHGVTVYLQKLAELFHVFYTKHRVISEDLACSRARLALIHATRWVLANGLGLLGVSAPRRM